MTHRQRVIAILFASIVPLAACGSGPKRARVADQAAPAAVAPEVAAAVSELGAGTGWALTVEAGTKLIKREAQEGYQEEFLLADILGVRYRKQADWDHPHLAEVMLRPGSKVRFAEDDAAADVAETASIAFGFDSQEDAEQAVEQLGRLAAR